MNIKLKSIFQKKVDRDINSVIKATYSEDAIIKQELEEFVVTDEIKVHIDKFLKEFTRSLDGITDNNGVWISGFFGSGKSHFLKILSYILSNKKVGGKSVISYFKGKGLKKSTLDNMKIAETIFTDVILFNIASKVEESAKQDSLLKVFERAFNEMRGLCESKPWVAAMEEQMISEGIYENFKIYFNEISNKKWEDCRENFYFERDYIIKTLVKVARISEEAAVEWCEKGEADYCLNVEKFALKVKDYCNSKGANHRVVFFIDEIGQYMGKDTKLMLSLQTIVEEVGLKSEGKCWVVVTAQEDLNCFLSKDSKDFSKILGRFNTKISLSSTNADEVIRKRLLKKNKKSQVYLQQYFEENESHIKNLIMFPKESGLNGYKDSNDFIETYPFVSYEFNILQLILNGISLKGHSGKDISRGERSLLEFYQKTVINYSDKTTENIIPLYAFYDEIQNYVNASAKEVLQEVQKSKVYDDFTLKVLKTLFLLKYVEILKLDAENISTMLISNLNDSKKLIRDKTYASLELLVDAGLVEKNRKGYVYLTKEEQLINKEIDHISVEKEEINEKLGDIVFHSIYKDMKFNYSSQYKFSFNRYVDNRLIGMRRSEIGIRIITSDYPVKGDKVSEFKRLSEGSKEVIVDISHNNLCVEVVEKLLKIDSYLRRNHNINLNEGFEKIYNRKIEEREEITLEAEELLRDALRKSQIFVASIQLQQGEKNGVEKINDGLNALINTEYFKLSYVKRFRNRIEDLVDILSEESESIESNVGELALEEVRAYIEVNTIRQNLVSLSDIILRFGKMPYGWKEIDVKGILLQLIKSNSIKGFFKNSLSNDHKDKVNQDIINNTSSNEILFKSKVKIEIKHLEVLKEVTKELFDISMDISDSEKAMFKFKELCKEELYIIKQMEYHLNNNRLYPGKNILNLGSEIFEDVMKKNEEIKFYKEVYELKQDFREYIDEVDEVKRFYFKNNNGKFNVLENGDQRIIYDKAIKALENYKDDEEYFEENKIIEIMFQIEDIILNKKPYSFIQRIPELLRQYEEKNNTIISSEVNRIEGYCEKCREEIFELLAKDDFAAVRTVNEVFDKIATKISSTASLMQLAALEKLIERRASSLKNKFLK